MRMRIVLALETLLQEYPLKKVSVSDICRATGISRPTFYKYFSNKYRIIQWYWDKLHEDTLKGLRAIPDWRDRFRMQMARMIGFMRDNERLFIWAFRSEGYYAELNRESIMDHGYHRRVEYLERVIGEKTGVPITPSQRFTIEFYVRGETSAVASWLRSAERVEPEQLAEQMFDCFPQRLYSLMDGTSS